MTRKRPKTNFANSLRILANKQHANDIPSSKFNFDTFMGNKSPQNMFLAPTDPNEVPKLIDSIKRKTSSRYDGITPALIKVLKYEISYPVGIPINKSLSIRIVPESSKITKVIPIYKETGNVLIIIDQYHYYQPSPKYLRK